MKAHTVVALHGFMGSLEDFASLPLTHACKWVGVDLLGHGKNDSPTDIEPYRTATQIKALEASINRLGLHRFILLGYSKGGRLALQYAVQHSDRLAGLMIVGATPGMIDEQERLQRRQEDETLANQIEEKGVAWLNSIWSQKPLIRTQKQFMHPQEYEAMQMRRLNNNPAGLANSLRGFGTGIMPHLWDQLHLVKCPVQLVTGEADAKFSSIAIHMLPRLQQASHLVVPAAGHAAHLENPAYFTTASLKWMSHIKCH